MGLKWSLPKVGWFECNVEHATAQAIAYKIRAELVCCDIYERTVKVGGWCPSEPHPMPDYDYHDLCYWGEAAARIAETYPGKKGQP